METPRNHEEQPKKEKAMLMFATGGVQNNFVRKYVPIDQHVIFTWEEANGLTHERLTTDRGSVDVNQVIRQIGIRQTEPADMEVGYDASMTAEEFAAKIASRAAALPDPREYEITGIVPDVFGFNEEFVAQVAEYYGVNCAPVETVRLLSDKAETGMLLKEVGFPVPNERLCDAPLGDGRYEQILAAAEEIGGDVIVKPNDGAGSIGCEDDSPSLSEEVRQRRIGRHIADLARYQEQFSRPSASVTLVQERLGDKEAGLQLLTNKGYLFPVYTRKEMYGNKEVGHYYDAADPFHDWCQTYISPHLPRLIGRLGVDDWFLNGDIRIPEGWEQMPIRRDNPALVALDAPAPEDPAKFHLIDLQARLGGDGLAVMQTRVFGKNFGKIIIDVSLGKDVRSELANAVPKGAAAIEVGFPDGGVMMADPNVAQFANALMDQSLGAFHANVNMFMGARKLMPLTSFFYSGEHPVIGASGKNTADVRRNLDSLFSATGAMLFSDSGIDTYLPGSGLVHIRGEGDKELTIDEAYELVMKWFTVYSDQSDPNRPPFTVRRIAHSDR